MPRKSSGKLKPPWRHVVAVLALPMIVTLVAPALILVLQARLGWQVAIPPILRWTLMALGAFLVLGGLGLMAWTISLFVRVGRGTLAPWDPPSRLVIVGPYGHVRNPMMTGVFAVLAGEAALFGSWGLLIWVVVFVVGNLGWVRYWEEPDLRRRFGQEYRTYQRHVPRWIPRFKPWRPHGE
ncbi:MAG: isoprenylcysteine carboxylmethyltransferase family protein [Proteobacteria bacterium]|nr:isoprenylcysteine carboxylmethyltransferase family protein [Pseudomonadota bacterium]